MPRPNKPWYRTQQDAWVIKIAGRQITLARGKKNKAEAIKEFHRIKAQEVKPAGATAGLSVLTLAEAFLDFVERDRAPETYDRYRQHVRGFINHVGGGFPAADIKPHHVTAWVASHHETWSQNTRRDAIVVVKRLFKWFKEQGYLPTNLLAEMKQPPRVSRDVALGEADVNKIVEAIDHEPFRNFVVMMRETGARPNEVMKLEAAHIDWDNRVAVMASKTTRATGRPRKIILSDVAIALARELAAKWPEGPILRNEDGRPWTRWSTGKAFRKVRAKLGLGAGAVVEAIRHGWITDALERGIPIATVATLAGHTSTTMVARVYSKLHQRDDHLHEAMRVIRGGRPREADD